MLRTTLTRLLFVAALLFTQQVAVMHTIEHTLVEQKQSPASAHHQHCDLCAIDAQMGSAIGSSALHFDFSHSFTETRAAHEVAFRSTTFAAFAARAPPRYA